MESRNNSRSDNYSNIIDEHSAYGPVPHGVAKIVGCTVVT